MMNKKIKIKINIANLSMVKYHNISSITLLIREYSVNSLKPKTDFKSGLPRETFLAPQWVTGIIDSEGNFSVTIQETNNKSKVSLALKVTQKEHSKGILLDLQNYFGCGNIYIDNRKENAYKFSVNKINDILTKVIPHLDNYPLLTSKNLDYLDFKKVALLVRDKAHLEDVEVIQVIKKNMNSSRSFEER